MRLVVLLLVLSCSMAVLANRGVNVRTISITELLKENPGLKEELQQKIAARKSTDGPTSAPATASAPATTTTTTTTPTPPSSTTTESPSTTAKSRQNGRRRRPGAVAGRGRVRVAKENAEEKPVQNARTFPQ